MPRLLNDGQVMDECNQCHIAILKEAVCLH